MFMWIGFLDVTILTGVMALWIFFKVVWKEFFQSTVELERVFSSPEQSSGWAFVILECPSSVVRRPSCVNNFVVTILAATFLSQSFSIFIRMFVLMMSRSSSIMGGAGSKSRSLGQILVKSCYHSRNHIFGLTYLKLAQNVCLDDVSVKFDHGWDRVKK